VITGTSLGTTTEQALKINAAKFPRALS